ncbi:MAG: uracil-DNA glycosylase [Halomonadaceae bacterium]|nr:uracil-DNA glycosylase [Halomonadaceae bacterium]
MLKQACWNAAVGGELEKPYMRRLMSYLESEILAGKAVLPKPSQWFAALDVVPLGDVKCVIVGQDPYPTPGHAHGLSFSVERGVGIPRSLRNIYKELEVDVGMQAPDHGNLHEWARQGVLLLNDTLSVEAGNAGAHQGRGWSEFTDQVVDVVNEQCENVVFMLWGAFAQKKGRRISRDRHLVLECPHPSPLSARRGFFGCRHFSLANTYLTGRGRGVIYWEALNEVEPA